MVDRKKTECKKKKEREKVLHPGWVEPGSSAWKAGTLPRRHIVTLSMYAMLVYIGSIKGTRLVKVLGKISCPYRVTDKRPFVDFYVLYYKHNHLAKIHLS